MLLNLITVVTQQLIKVLKVIRIYVKVKLLEVSQVEQLVLLQIINEHLLQLQIKLQLNLENQLNLLLEKNLSSVQ